MDKLKAMSTFKIIMEEGSFVGAARKLGVTKAAVSKQIIELESHFKAQLMHRTTRSIQFTDAGKLFYESVKKILQNITEAESIFFENKYEPEGILRITSHRNFGEKYIINHLKEFMDRYPKLKIDIELADRFPDLEKENIDILCGVAHEGPDHLVRKKIVDVQHVLCASPDYLSRFGIPKTPEELKFHRYITHSFRDPNDIILFNNGKEILLDHTLRLNDSQSMLKCALQGLGFIKILDYFVEQALKEGSLVEILKKYKEKKKGMYIFYQYQKFTPLKIRLFLDFIYEKVEHHVL
jgi:DNA-binding transcriptional LysR family regulator